MEQIAKPKTMTLRQIMESDAINLDVEQVMWVDLNNSLHRVESIERYKTTFGQYRYTLRFVDGRIIMDGKCWWWLEVHPSVESESND